jgi:hypothetical protein
MPPGWLAVPEQAHLPLELVEQVAFHPAAENALPILEQSTLMEETDKHEASKRNVMDPLVVVSSL